MEAEITPETMWPGSPNGAIFSPDDARLYRYSLHRAWAVDRLPEVWVMCNPSTATESVLDATLRRVRDYSHTWGAGGFVVVNLYAYRATDPDVMRAAADPIGPRNDEALRAACQLCAGRRMIAAWGAVGAKSPGADERVRRLRAYAAVYGVELCSLANVNSGAPQHPLRLPSRALPTRWPG